MTLSIVDPGGNHLVDVTGDTLNCPTGWAEGQDCDPSVKACELGANVACTCVAKDMCDPSIDPAKADTGGTLNCTFPPLSTVIATFDRIIDTAPLDANAQMATLTSTPAQALMTSASYTPNGSSTNLVFSAFYGDPLGPTLAISGAPAAPVSSTVTYTLSKTNVVAKDHKTAFTGPGLLVDGQIAFKTSGFAASITVPAAPAMDMGGSSAPTTCPAPADAGSSDAGAADGGVSDAGATSDAGAASDAGATSDAATASDAATVTPPSTDVPADMNTGAITIDFTNTVDMTVLAHITITEDGQPFTAVNGPDPTKDLPASELKYTPKTAWAPGKTYTITIDKDAADVLGTKLGAPVTAFFKMAQ